MIFKGDRFLLNDHAYLLLHCEPETDSAWAIDINVRDWPREFNWSQIRNLKPYAPKSITEVVETNDEGIALLVPPVKLGRLTVTNSLNPTPAMIAVRDNALELLGPLIDSDVSYPRIFEAKERCQMVMERAQEAGCSVPTIYKHLRQFWLGGQKPSALLGNFHRCGQGQSGTTASRGAKPEFARPIFQLNTADFGRFDRVIEETYLSGDLRSISYTHQKLLEDHYTTVDGNGDEYILPEGERPTLRQFQHYLLKTLPLEKRLRSRKGDKDFERDHRPVLGTVMDVCDGVGHIYEADASELDIFLVAADDIKTIIGKPTLYLVMDRKSRLIVGWYLGLENASWTVAMLAFASISQDKQSICARLGIKYEQNDWPAHEIFPKQVLGDRSELITKASCQLATELQVIVSNLPSKRPDWKPVVECEFKQTRMVLQPGAPGFDPPENAMKRQGKRYDKDACLTLLQLERIILAAIIAHNRKPLPGYPRTLKEIGNEVPPIPIALWNHDLVERSGLLPKFDEETVRKALLPRDEASISEEGILFKDCHYSCQEALAKGWLTAARRSRFKLQVAFDRRLVDKIYVYDPNDSSQLYECRLTTRSERYRGMSFSEVYAVERIQRRDAVQWKQIRTQVSADFNGVANPEYEASKKALKDAKLKSSRRSRRVDSKEAREVELSKTRQEQAPISTAPTKKSAKVLPFSSISGGVARASAESSVEAPQAVPNAAPSAEEKKQLMKERMLRGQL